MNLRILKHSMTFILALYSTLGIAAGGDGGQSGGGGNAVLCYSNSNIRDIVFKDIRSNPSAFNFVDLQLNKLQSGFKPQLLDLWDSRKQIGFPGESTVPTIYSRRPEEVYAELNPISDSIILALNEMDRESATSVLKEARTNSSQWVAEPNGVVRIDDMTIQGQFPKNCLVAQVAFFNDTTLTVHYDARILALMDVVDQNALRVHEDIYHAVRLRIAVLRSLRADVQNSITSAYKSAAYRNGATVDDSGIAVIDKLIKTKLTSDLTRSLVSNLFTNKSYTEVTRQKLSDTLE